jgi:hypothetical protein
MTSGPPLSALNKALFESNMEGTFPIKKLTGGDFYLGMQVMMHDMEAGTISLTHQAYSTNMLATYKVLKLRQGAS